jgi:glycosyltransferase involved in cell wall biosynthesis
VPHYDVTVLAVNFRGDPEGYPDFLRGRMWAAAGGNDAIGVGRLLWMCDRVKPDVIVIQNDGWFIPYYIAQLRKRKPSGEYLFPEHAAIPVVAAVAVDGKNFRGAWIKDVTLAIFWTQFALDEARIGGYAGDARVIPLGVDMETFYPVERQGALERQQATGLKDFFVVGNVNRNQPRKRWDLTIKYFAEWVHSRNITDAELFMHAAPTGDESINVQQLAQYYGILDRLALCQPETFYGKPDDDMRDTYNCFDAYITTTQGEGFGLTTLEAMACGVPCILPAWSALGDWAKGAAALVPCTTTALQSDQTVNGTAVIGGVADQRAFIEALDALYRDKHQRKVVANLGLARAREPQFRWDSIGAEWVGALDALFAAPEQVNGDEIWQELKPAQQSGAGAACPSRPEAGLGKAPAHEGKLALAGPQQPDAASRLAASGAGLP